ncbi:MAG: hypothetical protein FWF87_07730 [Synergistaceae bacterium]|nr:hypothetical protein [Synergistaceae bacterium]
MLLLKILSIDRALCNACGACEICCSIRKTKSAGTDGARIRLMRPGGAEAAYVTFCQHCAESACVTACLKNIIEKNADTGTVTRRTEGCFACAACYVQCPVGAVTYDSAQNVYTTCDFCDGDPLCVKICPTGALSYAEPSNTSRDFREAYSYDHFHKLIGESEL